MANNLTQYGGTPVKSGRYKINYTDIELVVTDHDVSIRGRTMSPHFIEFTIPLGHHVETNPEDDEARELVLSYLAAAWPHRQWEQLNDWMTAEEQHNGPSVWRLRYCHDHGDPIRQLIEQEVAAWLKAQAPSPSRS